MCDFFVEGWEIDSVFCAVVDVVDANPQGDEGFVLLETWKVM